MVSLAALELSHPTPQGGGGAHTQGAKKVNFACPLGKL